ncbi:MAG: GTP-binding protein [Candidatus Heimdallarchaeota archaeon]
MEKDLKKDTQKSEKSEDLVEFQLKSLKLFLESLDYTKESMISIFDPRKIVKEEDKDKIPSDFPSEFPNNLKVDPTWGAVLHFLIQLYGLEQFISQIANDLYIKFEKTISQGQAEAVLKRVLDIKLSSTGRTQLYELRKKIRRYEKFIAHFKDWGIYDYTFKITIMGLDTEYAQKLLSGAPLYESFQQRLVIGVEFYPKQIKISDKMVKLQVWNISAKEEFNFLRPTYYLGANGALIVFNKSNRDSFNLAEKTYQELKNDTNLEFELNEKKGTYVPIPLVLIGLDKLTTDVISDDEKVSAEEGQTLARKIGASYIEISETDTINFENVFSSLSLLIIKNHQKALKRHIDRFRFKIAFVGDPKAGKSSVIQRYTKASFTKDYIKTIGAQFSVYDKNVGEDRVRCLFWDIAGSESFHFLRRSFIEKSSAAIIVYSLREEDQEKDILSQITDWYEEIIRYSGNIPIVIWGNKIDLVDESKLDDSEIQEFIKKNNILGYYLTSAKTGEGIIEAFDMITEELYNSHKPARKFRFKITVVGDGHVGKTSLIKQFTKSSFKLNFVNTIGAQFAAHDTEIDGDKIRSLFWDIAGPDEFHFLRPSFYKNSRAAIIVYSLEENKRGEESFAHITDWYKDILIYGGDIPIIIIGNKADRVDETKLDLSKIQKIVNENNLVSHFITSAKTGKGVIQAFNSIIETLYSRYKKIFPV